MSIVERFKASWELVKLSWHVLMQDKELLLFPIISTIAGILLFLGIVVPSFFIPGLGPGNMYWGGLVIWYFVAAFVTIFMQAALIACVRKRLHGGDPTIGYGLKEAGKRFVPILLWSLIATTVGVLLRMLSNAASERGGIQAIIGQIIVGIIGFAWTIITMFVIPVIVMENQGVFASMKRSAQLVKKTWGEQVIMTIGLSTAFGYLYVALVLIVLLTWIIVPFLGLIVLILCLIALAVLLVIQVTLEGVFNGVLYSYAAGDNIPREFKERLATIFVKKQ